MPNSAPKRNNRLIANTRTGKEPIEQLEPRNYYVNILKIPSDLIPVLYTLNMQEKVYENSILKCQILHQKGITD